MACAPLHPLIQELPIDVDADTFVIDIIDLDDDAQVNKWAWQNGLYHMAPGPMLHAYFRYYLKAQQGWAEYD